jgi:hypothetical protein
MCPDRTVRRFPDVTFPSVRRAAVLREFTRSGGWTVLLGTGSGQLILADAESFVWTATDDEGLAKIRVVHVNIKKLVDNNAKQRSGVAI